MSARTVEYRRGFVDATNGHLPDPSGGSTYDLGFAFGVRAKVHAAHLEDVKYEVPPHSVETPAP